MAATYSVVSDHYGAYADVSTETPTYNTTVASAFGYSAADLASIPASANLGVSCGNPLATASLKPGETLVDLGSVGGLDAFLAARTVGAAGRAIGVDMTPKMVELARRNAAAADPPYTNVEFVLANITDIAPLADAVADVVVSNCVINLVPDQEKPKVFKEIWRILKKGGRMAVSDILARTAIPEHVRSDVGLYIGCVSGASQVAEYQKWMEEAGFKDVMIVDTKKDLNIYKEGILSMDDPAENNSSCCEPKPVSSGCCGGKTESSGDLDSGRKERLEKMDLNEHVGSYQIYAIKPSE